ncbi:MAG: FHA domain-containing protein [Gracilibacteraceae bacterium]|jgi:hypothetical protein|nr:FHA domain-containing protein [Gracilibacteraceae bacterium]
MFARRLLIILSAFIVAICPAAACFAEGSAVLSQAYTWEQNIDVFIAGGMNSDDLSCKVSNQAAEITGSGLLADEGITVRTTILLDISTSMPSETRGSVKAYINSLIENIGPNEQYQIITFAEQLIVLQAFSPDRRDLAGAVEKIEFNGRESKIYDAIYNTIPQTAPLDGSPCYYRTIVITDGADDTVSGVTKEELYLKLQADTYPIDVVAVNSAKQTEPSKELSALTRISGGRYSELRPETDVAALSANLAADGIFWLRAAVPGILLDGSMRQVDIFDGVNTVQFDLKFPVFDEPVTEPLLPETDPAEAAPVSVPPPVKVNSPFGEYSMVVYIGGGAGLIIAVALIAALIVMRGRKKKASDPAPAQDGANVASGETELLSGSNNFGGENPCIRLRNAGAVDQVWDITLTKDVLIGRDTGCQVCIADGAVSRQHCKIYVMGVVTVENLSQTNKTLLNGEQLNSPAALKTGDRLKCGRVTLIVDELYNADSPNVGDLNKGTRFINV